MTRKKKRQPIKLRNALTELWNDGASIEQIAYECGVSVAKAEAYLASARKGYHTPAQQAEAESK